MQYICVYTHHSYPIRQSCGSSAVPKRLQVQVRSFRCCTNRTSDWGNEWDRRDSECATMSPRSDLSFAGIVIAGGITFIISSGVTRKWSGLDGGYTKHTTFTPRSHLCLRFGKYGRGWLNVSRKVSLDCVSNIYSRCWRCVGGAFLSNLRIIIPIINYFEYHSIDADHALYQRRTNLTFIMKDEPSHSSMVTGWFDGAVSPPLRTRDTSVWHNWRFASLHCSHFSPKIFPCAKEKLIKVLGVCTISSPEDRRWVCSDMSARCRCTPVYFFLLPSPQVFVVSLHRHTNVHSYACGVSAAVYGWVWNRFVSTGWAVHCPLHWFHLSQL